MKWFLTAVVLVISGASLTQGCISGDECNAENFSGHEWCEYCAANRQGQLYYEHPYDHSCYWQCEIGLGGVVTPIKRCCSACTYWSKLKNTCDSLSNARKEHGAGAKLKVRGPFGHTCNRYYECFEAGGHDTGCCENSPGSSFDNVNALYGGEPICVPDATCTDVCHQSTSSTTPTTTTQGPTYQATCAPSNWPQGYHVIDLNANPVCYRILSTGGTVALTTCCARNQRFDLPSCSCKAETVIDSGCLLVYINFNDGVIEDVIQHNHIDKGTATTTSNGWGNFGGGIADNLQVSFFSGNLGWKTKLTFSVWFRKTGNGDNVGVLSNGNCGEDSPVNIWVEGSEVKGGFCTGTGPCDVDAVAIKFEIDTRVWHHVVLNFKKYSDSSSTYCLYVDGAKAGCKSGNGLITNSYTALTIGKKYCVNANEEAGAFEGVIDNFQFYQCCLDESTIESLYEDQRGDVSMRR